MIIALYIVAYLCGVIVTILLYCLYWKLKEYSWYEIEEPDLEFGTRLQVATTLSLIWPISGLFLIFVVLILIVEWIPKKLLG
jgi:hypothetical protein